MEFEVHSRPSEMFAITTYRTCPARRLLPGSGPAAAAVQRSREGGAVPLVASGRDASRALSSARDEIPSLRNALVRSPSTVLGERNSSAASCFVVFPSAANSAVCRSLAVSAPEPVRGRLRQRAPAARSSVAVRSMSGGASRSNASGLGIRAIQACQLEKVAEGVVKERLRAVHDGIDAFDFLACIAQPVTDEVEVVDG
jgi:hypothetical protein